jgi:hypothetical protein
VFAEKFLILHDNGSVECLAAAVEGAGRIRIRAAAANAPEVTKGTQTDKSLDRRRVEDLQRLKEEKRRSRRREQGGDREDQGEKKMKGDVSTRRCHRTVAHRADW